MSGAHHEHCKATSAPGPSALAPSPHLPEFLQPEKAGSPFSAKTSLCLRSPFSLGPESTTPQSHFKGAQAEGTDLGVIGSPELVMLSPAGWPQPLPALPWRGGQGHTAGEAAHPL